MSRTVALALLIGAVLISPGPVAAEDDYVPTPLTLRAEITAGPAVSGKPIELMAIFTAWEKEAVKLYVPPHVPTVHFPTWKLRHADGRVFTPHQASFQSMWPNGLMGKILRIEPDGIRKFHTTATLFVQLDDEGKPHGPGDAMPLPAGLYSVHAEYRRESTQLPYGRPNFRTEYRDHPDVFTGTVKSGPIELSVGPGKDPMVQLEAPRAVRAGQPFPLTIKISRGATQKMTRRAAVRVFVSSKGGGNVSAWYLLRDGKLVQDLSRRRVGALGIEPGTTFTATLDLAEQTFNQVRGSKTVDGGLYELVAPGGVMISVQLRDGKQGVISGAGLSRAIQPLEPTPHDGLRVALERVSDRTHNPEVDVVLRNEGEKPVRVPASLTHGRHVFFSMVDEHKPQAGVYRVSLPDSTVGVEYASMKPGRLAKIAPDLAWAGEKFEVAAPSADQAYVLLPAGGELRRRFRLGDLISNPGGLHSRVMRVNAFFRNREPGLRLGLSDVFTGVIKSEPLTVRGRIW